MGDTEDSHKDLPRARAWSAHRPSGLLSVGVEPPRMNVREVVPRDAIPSVDDPEFGADYAGDPDDDVIVLTVDGETRAYPVRYLHYHEVVNDRVGDRPVAVTWCPLCGSAVVYERVVGGRESELGVSGKLDDDDLVLYDRATGSEWKQSSGVCIAGDREGEELTVLPAALVSYARFRSDHPDAPVLQPPGGESEAASDGDDPASIDYDLEPYERYFETEGFGLGAHRGTGEGREWDRADLAPKAVVLGLTVGDDALGFPLERVREAGGVVQTSVGGESVVVFAGEDGIHAFADPGYDFSREDDGFVADGTTWNPASGRAADGRELRRLPARRLFAFAWQDDHGAEAFWGGRPGE